MKTRSSRRDSGHSNTRIAVVIILFVLCAAALLIWVRAASPSFAVWRAKDLLASGDTAEAAALCRRAIERDPEILGAWVGLVRAEPSSENCLVFGSEFPEFFDPWQPTTSPAYCIPASSDETASFEPIRPIFDGLTKEDGDGAERIIALDYHGRKEVSGSWQQLNTIRQELDQKLRQPFLSHQLRPFINHDFDGARTLIANAVQRFASPKDWLDTLSELDNAARANDSGIKKLKLVVNDAPDYVPSHLTLIYLDIACGRTADAKQKIDHALKVLGQKQRASAEVRLRYALARVHEMEGHDDLAVSELKRALRVAPEDISILLRLAELEVRIGRIDEALAIADRISEGREFDTRTSYIKGIAYCRTGRYELAVSQLLLGMKTLNYGSVAHYELAFARFGTNQPLLASNEFVQYSLQTGDVGWPLAAASACALAAGYGKEAGDAASGVLADQDVIARTPALDGYARRFKIASQIVAGGNGFQNIGVEPLMEGGDREVSNYLIAGIWAAQGYVAADSNIQVSAEEMNYFAKRAANEPSAQYCLAFLQLASGDIAQGKATLEALLERSPDYPLAALHLARLYMLEGKTERAARVLGAANGLANSATAERVLAMIDELQGVKAPSGEFRHSSTIERRFSDGTAVDEKVVGPHLVLFTSAVHADPRSYMQKVLMLDPVSEFGYDVLQMAYDSIRSEGLAGVATSADKNPQIDLYIRKGLAIYETSARKIYDLVIGRFWKEIPQDL